MPRLRPRPGTSPSRRWCGRAGRPTLVRLAVAPPSVRGRRPGSGRVLRGLRAPVVGVAAWSGDRRSRQSVRPRRRPNRSCRGWRCWRPLGRRTRWRRRVDPTRRRGFRRSRRGWRRAWPPTERRRWPRRRPRSGRRLGGRWARPGGVRRSAFERFAADWQRRRADRWGCIHSLRHLSGGQTVIEPSDAELVASVPL